jgi:hypothetical protein
MSGAAAGHNLFLYRKSPRKQFILYLHCKSIQLKWHLPVIAEQPSPNYTKYQDLGTNFGAVDHAALTD